VPVPSWHFKHQAGEFIHPDKDVVITITSFIFFLPSSKDSTNEE